MTNRRERHAPPAYREFDGPRLGEAQRVPAGKSDPEPGRPRLATWPLRLTEARSAGGGRIHRDTVGDALSGCPAASKRGKSPPDDCSLTRLHRPDRIQPALRGAATSQPRAAGL